MAELAEAQVQQREEFERISKIAAQLRFAWDNAMDDFFQNVERERRRSQIKIDDLKRALDMHYSSDLGDEFVEWWEAGAEEGDVLE